MRHRTPKRPYVPVLVDPIAELDEVTALAALQLMGAPTELRFYATESVDSVMHMSRACCMARTPGQVDLCVVSPSSGSSAAALSRAMCAGLVVYAPGEDVLRIGDAATLEFAARRLSAAPKPYGGFCSVHADRELLEMEGSATMLEIIRSCFFRMVVFVDPCEYGAFRCMPGIAEHICNEFEWSPRMPLLPTTPLPIQSSSWHTITPQKMIIEAG